MEMADGVLITKADGNNIQKAKSARNEYAHALHLFPPTESGWIPKVEVCSALNNEGILHFIEIIDQYKNLVRNNGYFEKKRRAQLKDWLHQSILEKLKNEFYNSPKIKQELEKIENSFSKTNLNPYKLAAELISKWKS
jgi:LAO/AO transport system kinase